MTGKATQFTLKPITLRAANDFVEEHHRHRGRTPRNGGKFAVAAMAGSDLVGVAVVGNPLSATFMDGYTAEVLRLAVRADAPRNTSSFLLGAAWRAWRSLGGRLLLTYCLASESGASLRAAGWIPAATVPANANWLRLHPHMDPATSTYQPSTEPKVRWEKRLP